MSKKNNKVLENVPNLPLNKVGKYKTMKSKNKSTN